MAICIAIWGVSWLLMSAKTLSLLRIVSLGCIGVASCIPRLICFSVSVVSLMSVLFTVCSGRNIFGIFTGASFVGGGPGLGSIPCSMSLSLAAFARLRVILGLPNCGPVCSQLAGLPSLP